MAVAAPALIALQAGSALMGGIAENKAARREARSLDENGRITQLTGEQDVLAQARASRMEEGEAVAAAGGSGQQSIGSGSIADMIYANAAERQIELLNIRATASSQAAGLRAQARDARSRGKSALYGGIFRAGAAVLSGVSDMRNAAKLDTATQAVRDWEKRQPQQTGAIKIPRGNVFSGSGGR